MIAFIMSVLLIVGVGITITWGAYKILVGLINLIHILKD